jgi:phosphate uptake regulator
MTNEEKQIEEMANDIEKSHWKIVQDFMGCHINSEEMAEHLYTKGYRKASDVAREIEEIIDEEINVFEKARIDLYPRQDSYYAGVFVKSLSEIKEKLKKKYESEGGE